MNIIIHPSRLAGTVCAPPSKSQAHRLLICSALADTPTRIELDGTNRDIDATVACLCALGANIHHRDRGLDVTPIRHPTAAAELDCGESGSTLRFLMPVSAALGANVRITGHGRLPQRPNGPLMEALRTHGAQIQGDHLPLSLSGPLQSGLWTLPGDVSSQYVTGLLLAMPILEGENEIRLSSPLESAPYVDMTLQALRHFGVIAEPTPQGWRVPAGQKYRSPGNVIVEGDWSASAFWLAANALGADIRILGLAQDTTQGDRAATALFGQQRIDATHVPDLVPILAAVAAFLPQETVIFGARRLRLKESDRLKSTQNMLLALGHPAQVTEDGLVIHGGPADRCTTPVRRVEGINDHRIVMAASIAAAFSDRPVLITDAQAAEKSYPGFFEDLQRLGGRADVEHDR